MIGNILLPEADILNILSGVFPLWTVQGVPDTESTKAYAQFGPALYLYSAILACESRSKGRLVVVLQQYTVIIAIRNVSDIKSGAAARRSAGEAAVGVINALSGIIPTPGWAPLEMSVSQHPSSYSDGLFLLPLTFDTNVSLQNIRIP
jgi:hypothetical protein